MSLSKIVAQGVRNPFSAPDKQHMLYSAQNCYWCNISSTSFIFFFCSFENHSCHILKKAKFNWIYWSLWAECPHNYEAKKPLSSPRVNVEENFNPLIDWNRCQGQSTTSSRYRSVTIASLWKQGFTQDSFVDYWRAWAREKDSKYLKKKVLQIFLEVTRILT